MNKNVKKAKKYVAKSQESLKRCFMYFLMALDALADAALEYVAETYAGKAICIAGVFAFAAGIAIAWGFSELAGILIVLAMFAVAVVAADLKGMLN